MGNLRYGKSSTGGGEKPSDKYVVPLCHRHHNEGPESQHATNEAHWWRGKNIDPILVSALLFQVSGDQEAGVLICQGANELRMWSK